jgi:hypothetical protein
MVSHQTETIYVAFSSGLVFTYDDYLSRVKQSCEKLIRYLTQQYGKYRICLCGHSMGAVYGLATAYFWLQENAEFFNQNVTCVLFGPHKILPHDYGFLNHPKIFVFFTSSLEYGPDSFMFKGSPTHVQYSPIYLILPSNISPPVFHTMTNRYSEEDSPASVLHSLSVYEKGINMRLQRKGGKRKYKNKTLKNKTRKIVRVKNISI